MPARHGLAALAFALVVPLPGCRTAEERCEEDLRLARKAISKLDYRLASSFRDKAREHCGDSQRVENLSADIEKLRARRAKR
jgi:hypothetical protein